MSGPMDHLDYEVEMLVETYKRAAHEPDRIMRNALIESFCTHARLLFELFEKEAKAPKYSNGYVPRHKPTHYNNILNNQISHMGALRTHDDSKKINHEMRTEMLDRIRDDLAHFKTCMLDQAAAARTRDVPSMSVVVPTDRPSPTNAIQTSQMSTTTVSPTITSIKITS